MATYNTIIKKRNASNDGWDSILPITLAENVLTDSNGGTLASHIADDANPNLLINGAFNIWQRGTSFSVPDATSQYTADRWKCATGGGATATISKNNPGLLAIKNTSGGYVFLLQPIENSTALNGKKITVSVDCSTFANVGTVQFGIRRTSDASTIDFSIEPSFLGIKTLTIDIPANYGEFSVFFHITSEVVATGGIEIRNVKLEIGSKNTPYYPRLIADELNACRRYSYVINGGMFYFLAKYDVNTLTFQGYFGTDFRVAPTFIGTENVQWEVRKNGVAQTGFTISTSSSTAGSISFTLSKTAHGLTNADLIVLVLKNYSILDAEI